MTLVLEAETENEKLVQRILGFKFNASNRANWIVNLPIGVSPGISIKVISVVSLNVKYK